MVKRYVIFRHPSPATLPAYQYPYKDLKYSDKTVYTQIPIASVIDAVEVINPNADGYVFHQRLSRNRLMQATHSLSPIIASVVFRARWAAQKMVASYCKTSTTLQSTLWRWSLIQRLCPEQVKSEAMNFSLPALMMRAGEILFKTAYTIS